jgi:hypothetical protein
MTPLSPGKLERLRWAAESFNIGDHDKRRGQFDCLSDLLDDTIVPPLTEQSLVERPRTRRRRRIRPLEGIKLFRFRWRVRMPRKVEIPVLDGQFDGRSHMLEFQLSGGPESEWEFSLARKGINPDMRLTRQED